MNCKKSEPKNNINDELNTSEEKDKAIIQAASENAISLPFDKDNFDNNYNSKIYPILNKNKHSIIKEVISKYKPENSEANSIRQIKNGKKFDSYLYFIDGDSSFSELININSDKKVISSLGVSYYYPQDETYDTFQINEDLVITTFEVNKQSKEKIEIGKYLIQDDGSIKTIFNHRKNKTIDPSKHRAPN